MIDLWSRDGKTRVVSVPYHEMPALPMPDIFDVPGVGLFVWVDNARQYRFATVHLVKR